MVSLSSPYSLELIMDPYPSWPRIAGTGSCLRPYRVKNVKDESLNKNSAKLINYMFMFDMMAMEKEQDVVLCRAGE